MSSIEIVATLFGIACVFLIIKRSIWCWPVGLVQVVLYAWIFHEVKLYSDFILHLIYIGLQFWGWYHWLHGGPVKTELPMSRLGGVELLGWSLVALLGSVLWGYGMSRWTDADLAYADAFVAVTSLVAQWLLTRKVLESWLFWILVDVVAIGVYLTKELYWTTGLYSIFLGMAIAGLLIWLRDWRRRESMQTSLAAG